MHVIFGVLFLIACVSVCVCLVVVVLGFVFLRVPGLFEVVYKHDLSMHFTQMPSL